MKPVLCGCKMRVSNSLLATVAALLGGGGCLDRVKPAHEERGRDVGLQPDDVPAALEEDVPLPENPVAVARAAVLPGALQTYRDPRVPLVVDIFSFLTLDGTLSTGAEGRELRFVWEAFYAPSEAGIVWESLRMAATTQILLDSSGRYLFDLSVFDDHALSDSDIVHVLSRDPSSFSLEILWSAGDLQRVQSHGDVDLHIVRNLGGWWMRAPGDCYFGNPHATWGAEGDAGDCRLATDCNGMWGCTAEFATIFPDELPASYYLGAHLRFMGDASPTVTANVYLPGTTPSSFEATLSPPNMFWLIGVYAPDAEPQARLSILNQLFPDFPREP